MTALYNFYWEIEQTLIYVMRRISLLYAACHYEYYSTINFYWVMEKTITYIMKKEPVSFMKLVITDTIALYWLLSNGTNYTWLHKADFLISIIAQKSDVAHWPRVFNLSPSLSAGKFRTISFLSRYFEFDTIKLIWLELWLLMLRWGMWLLGHWLWLTVHFLHRMSKMYLISIFIIVD